MSQSGETTIHSRLAANGRLVVPVAFRRALGIADGDELLLTLRDGELSVTTPKLELARIQRKLKQQLPPGVSMVDELLADRRREAQQESGE